MTTNLALPYGLALSSDGTKLYVSEAGGSTVQEITLASPVWDPAQSVSTLAGSFVAPYGLALLDSSTLLVAEFGTCLIKMVNLSSTPPISPTTFAGSGGT